MRTPRLATLAALAALCLTTLAPAASAQTPGCPTDTSANVVVNPRMVRAELPEHTATLLDGSPAVTAYLLGWYAQGASAPTSTTPISKTAWTLVSGTQYCYDANLPALAGIPLGQPFLGALKAVRGTDESPWSAASNPFGFQGPVVAPARVALRK